MGPVCTLRDRAQTETNKMGVCTNLSKAIHRSYACLSVNVLVLCPTLPVITCLCLNSCMQTHRGAESTGLCHWHRLGSFISCSTISLIVCTRNILSTEPTVFHSQPVWPPHTLNCSQPVCLPVCWPVCPSICLSICLSPFKFKHFETAEKNTFVFFNKYIFTPTHINKALHISKQEELLMNSVWRLFSFVLPALWCPYLDYIQGLLDVTLNFHFFSLSTQLVLELFDLPPYIYFRAKHNTGGMLCLSAIPMEQRSLILKIPASLPPGTPDILNPLHLKPQQLGGNYCKTAFIFSKYSEFPVMV